MKKFILTLILMLSCTLGFAQNVNFQLTPTGYFRSPEGRDFIVVPFESKSAHQIFKVLFENVGNVYRTIKTKAILTVDGQSVSIRAYNDKLAFNADASNHEWLGAYYNITMEIKDGRVKVNIPDIDQVMMNASGVRNKDFSKMVIGMFDGVTGKVLIKKQDQKYYVEGQVNKIINAILTGIYEDDDAW